MPQRKRRRLSPAEENGSTASLVARNPKPAPIPVHDYLESAANWTLEQDYENRPRKAKGKKDKGRLPIKTEEGWVKPAEPEGTAAEESDSFLQSASDEESNSKSNGAAKEPVADPRPSHVVIQEAKEEMARIAGLINQDPEEFVGGLKTLAQLAESPNVTVKKLALIAQLAIFKDIVPGYRIRPLDQESMIQKVSKEVRRLRSFEQSLVSSYTNYVGFLTTWTRARHEPNSELSEVTTVALSCACNLVTAVPHFNCRDELLKIIINKLSRRKVDSGHVRCVSAIEQLFREDDEGVVSQETVALLTRMMKTRDYEVDETVLNTFLHLRLLNEFSSKASMDAVDGDVGKGKGKKPKQAREFRTKRERKALKELKAVEKEFQEADASVQQEQREHAQAETLKLVFGTYFRILKTRSPKLMGAVLEGLARYAHLINQDFFGDLLVTLQELASEALARLENTSTEEGVGTSDESLPPPPRLDYASALRRALLCTTTAFALLSTQEAWSLNLDLSSFAITLYTLLLHLAQHPDLELTSKTHRLPDPHGDGTTAGTSKVHATALSTLALRALSSALTPRHTPPVRLAAFAHRLMIAALQTPEKTTTAVLALVRAMVQTSGRRFRGVWSTDEQRGDGRFEPLAGIEECRPFCGTVFEGELLRLHYADGIRKGVGELEELVKGLA